MRAQNDNSSDEKFDLLGQICKGVRKLCQRQRHDRLRAFLLQYPDERTAANRAPRFHYSVYGTDFEWGDNDNCGDLVLELIEILGRSTATTDPKRVLCFYHMERTRTKRGRNL
jgi:hypothetical protein